jgi:hypothetical protein
MQGDGSIGEGGGGGGGESRDDRANLDADSKNQDKSECRNKAEIKKFD